MRLRLKVRLHNIKSCTALRFARLVGLGDQREGNEAPVRREKKRRKFIRFSFSNSSFFLFFHSFFMFACHILTCCSLWHAVCILHIRVRRYTTIPSTLFALCLLQRLLLTLAHAVYVSCMVQVTTQCQFAQSWQTKALTQSSHSTFSRSICIYKDLGLLLLLPPPLPLAKTQCNGVSFLRKTQTQQHAWNESLHSFAYSSHNVHEVLMMCKAHFQNTLVRLYSLCARTVRYTRKKTLVRLGAPVAARHV